jgi:hypothetical protein
MNCWEILGIDPTRDRAAIDRAYEQQKKFATGEELERLQQAYREASGQEPVEQASYQPETAPGANAGHEPISDASADVELTAQEQQLVREVVIQVKALLNDSRRASDVGIWRAILSEPPADQPHIRAEVAQSLEPQVRPMADNGSFPPAVAAFLGEWFGWQELSGEAPHNAPAQADDRGHDRGREDNRGSTDEGFADDNQPPVTNFWPAVVGWVVALVVLATFFESIFGG